MPSADLLVNALLLLSSGLLLGAVAFLIGAMLGARLAVASDKEKLPYTNAAEAIDASWRDSFGTPFLALTGIGALVAAALTLAPIQFEWGLFMPGVVLGFVIAGWVFRLGRAGGSPPTATVLVAATIASLVVANSGPVGYAMWNGGVRASTPPSSAVATTPPPSSVTATATPRVALEVSTVGTTGSVTSDPPGIRCPNVCSATFARGTAVSLAASPGTESIFKSWGNACTGATSCRVVLDQARAVSATFAQPTITVNLAGSGSGTVGGEPKFACGPTTCTGTFPRGTQVKISATPTFGSTFTEWTGDCIGRGTCGPVLDRDLVVGATFTQLTAPGYAASPCTPSASVSLRPGETRQLVGMFSNTGSNGWQRATSSQVNLAVCCPLNTVGPNGGWNSDWLSTIAYATATNAFVGPGNIGTFTFNIHAPAGATPGDYVFESGLVLASTGAPLAGASCRWTARVTP